MTNQESLNKMEEDMKMRGFSHWTEESYRGKAREIIKYFSKIMEEVTIEELRKFLLEHLKEEKKIIRKKCELLQFCNKVYV